MLEEHISGSNPQAEPEARPLRSVMIATFLERLGGEIFALVTLIFGVNDLRAFGVGESMNHLPWLVDARPGTR